MLATIEEKLSAMKAINEEKDACDVAISELINFKNQINAVDAISIHADQTSFDFAVPKDVATQVLDILEEYHEARRKELIEKAEALMK